MPHARNKDVSDNNVGTNKYSYDVSVNNVAVSKSSKEDISAKLLKLEEMVLEASRLAELGSTILKDCSMIAESIATVSSNNKEAPTKESPTFPTNTDRGDNSSLASCATEGNDTGLPLVN